MSKDSYFAQYVSPNILIVPTVSFCAPNIENKPDANISNHLMNVEQRVENYLRVPSVSNCIKHDLKEGVVNTTSCPIGSTGTSESSKKLPLTKQGTDSTEDPALNMSLRIKEMSSSKYKSRNNLVDLTGFNILKRECVTSSTKHKDNKQNTKTKIDTDLNKTIDKKENVKHVDSDSCRKENKSNKESPKRSKETSLVSRSEDNAKDSSFSVPKDDKTEMEEKMKKYFRLLWKRNFEKLKDKPGKEKRNRGKSSTTEQRRKDLTPESCKTKPKLQKVSKTTPTKSSKIKLKENHNCDRQIIAKDSSILKSETKSCGTSDTKSSTRDRKQFLSPVSIKRYKDFQRFIYNDDDDADNIKRVTGKQIKSEKSHDKKHVLKSRKSATNNYEPKQNALERKQSAKSNNRHHSTVTNSLDNTERVHLIKSVVKANKNLHSENLHSKCINESKDLRSKLSRKRIRSECFTRAPNILEDKLHQENLVVTVKQDVKTDPKTKLAPNVKKTKTKKCKKIKLVINIECPNSDSDSDQNDNECCASPQDLSFLDDFNIDEIVDSLKTSHNHIENNQINTTEISPSINKTNFDNITNKTNETRPKERLINDLNIKTIKIKKEETEPCGGRVIVINSETEDEDLDFEKGSITNIRKNKEAVKLQTNSTTYKKMKQETSNVKELNKKPLKNNSLKLMDICDDNAQKIKFTLQENSRKTSIKTQETNKIIELSTNFDKPKENKEKILEITSKKSLTIGNKNHSRKTDNMKNKKRATISKPKTNRKTNLILQNPENKSKKSQLTVEKSFEKKAKPLNKIKNTYSTKSFTDPIETSLETLFNNIEQNTSNKLDVELSDSDKPIKDGTLQHLGSSIEASLETMFNDGNQEYNMNIGFTNASDQHIKKDVDLSQNSQDAILQEHISNINKTQIKLLNKTDKNIKIQQEYFHKSEDNVQILQKSNKNYIQPKANPKMDNQQSEAENIKHKCKYSANSKVANNKKSRESSANIGEVNVDIKMNSAYSQGNIKENSEKYSFETDNKPKPYLETMKNSKGKKSDGKISLKKSNKTIQEKAESPGKPRPLTDKSLKIPNNSIEKHAEMPAKPSYISDKAIIRQKPGNCFLNAGLTKKTLDVMRNIQEQKVDQNDSRPLNTSGAIIEEKYEHLQNYEPTEPLETTLNNSNIKHHMKSLNMSDEHLKEIAQHLQISKITFKTPLVATRHINDKKAEIETDMQMDIVASDKNCEVIVENVLPSTTTVKSFLETPILKSKNEATTIDYSYNPNENVSGNLDGHLHKPENTTGIQSDDLIRTVEKIYVNMDVGSSSISDIEEKAGKNIQGTINTSDKQLNDNIAHKADGNTKLITNNDKNLEADSSIQEFQIRTEKSLPKIAKSNAEEKHVKSSEMNNKNIQNSGTMVYGQSKTNDSSKNSIHKDRATYKLDDTKTDGTVGDTKTVGTVEKKTNIKSDVDPSSISNKHIKEKTAVDIQGTIITSIKPLNDNLTHNVNANIVQVTHNENVASITNIDKKFEANSSIKESAIRTEKSLTIIAKFNAEEQVIKSPETDTNNIQTSETMVDGQSKIKDSSKNSIQKETVKLDEIKTSTKLKQKQTDSKEDLVSDGIENIDRNIQKDDTKSKQFEVTLPRTLKPFVKKLEARMLQYLEKKYTVTSLLHKGHFSVIYKCRDAKGENYAVKAYKAHSKGVFIERMLWQLQKYRIKGNSCLLYLINGFGVQGRWCLLTEYYPQNLEEALKENKKSFHIDLVQVLSRQLVEAVNVLTNNNIIHSDIKPSHILLNRELDRLKLSGFDRANYSDQIKIIPSTGTSSYRAPEIILGFSETDKIDVWSTALVMFEMATNTKLFPGLYNNDILYKQLCTLGGFDWDMVENSRFKNLYFFGTSFLRQVGLKGEKTLVLPVIQRNKKLRNQIFLAYNHHWARYRTRWQTTEDLDKLESLHTLLEQMLAMDPRHRLPIQFVSANEFIYDVTS